MKFAGTGPRSCWIWKLAVMVIVFILDKVFGATSELQRVALTQCCDSQKFYEVGLNGCYPWPADVTENGTSLSMFKDKNLIDLNPEGFQVLTNLISCPDGYVVKNTHRFQLHQNGSLSDQGGKRFPAGDFCLNRILGVDPLHQGGVVAHFCVPDPYKDTIYARKCCPQQMVVNASIQICQSHNSFVDFEHYVKNISESSLIVRSVGIPSTCRQEKISFFNPSFHPREIFLLKSDGSLTLKEKHFEIITDYCIDNFHNENYNEFMALICQPEPSLGQLIYPYILWMSSLFLIATFIVYVLIPSLRNIHGVTIMCYAASMSVMYISLGMTLTIPPSFDYSFCIGLAVVTHFSFLSTFTWLSMVSMDLCWTISAMKPRNVSNDQHRVSVSFVYYSLFAWGIPLVIVIIGQILDNVENLPDGIIKPHFGDERCWFNYDDKSALAAYVHGPVGVLVVINIVCFIKIVTILLRETAETSVAAGSRRANKQRFRLVFSLFMLMGVLWILEVVKVFLPERGVLYYIGILVDILNFSSGLFVFTIFVCKKKIWRILKHKIPFLEKLFPTHGQRKPSRPKKSPSSPAIENSSSGENQSDGTSGSDKMTVATTVAPANETNNICNTSV